MEDSLAASAIRAWVKEKNLQSDMQMPAEGLNSEDLKDYLLRFQEKAGNLREEITKRLKE